MTFQGLEYFLVVYEERNITTAAERLFITQQCLSGHIQRLEKACGIQLFNRRASLMPTYAGERFAEVARQILRLQKELLSEMRDISKEENGRMLVGFTAFLAGEHLPALLDAFHALHPRIDVVTITEPSSQLEAKALSGNLDFYIGSFSNKTTELRFFPLPDISLMIAVRASVLKSYYDFTDQQMQKALLYGISLAEIKELPFIFPRRGWRVREPIDRYLKKYCLKVRILLETTQQITLAACLKGLGAGVIYSVTPIVFSDDEDQLLRFFLKDIGYTVQPGICYRKDHFLTKYEQDFLSLTRKHFESEDGKRTAQKNVLI